VALSACPEPSCPAATPADAHDSCEKAARVREAVAGLPPHLREVVLLREYEDMTYAGIAAVLGCNEGTVKSRLARARMALRERLLPLTEDLR